MVSTGYNLFLIMKDKGTYMRNPIFYLLLIVACSFSTASAMSAENIPANSQVVITGNPVQGLNNTQMQLQLQAQELQLEQQILQIKQRLWQLQQQAAVQKNQSAQQAETDLRWVDAKGGKVPANPVIAALANGKPLYICRSNYLQGIHPGQLVDKGCLITYSGRALIQTRYQILTGKQAVTWKPGSALIPFSRPFPYYNSLVIAGNPAAGNANFALPVQGGYEPDHPLYICRVMYGENIRLGKTFPDGQACNIGVEGAEVHVQASEVLFD